MKKISLLIIVIILSLVLIACSSGDTEETEAPTLTPTRAYATGTVQPESANTETEPEEEGEEALVPEMMESVSTRTPVPTATPGVLVEEVTRITEELGVDEQTFLGLGVTEWLILLIAGLIILGVILFANWLVKRFLPRLADRTETELDNRLLDIAAGEILWLAIIITLRFVTVRLVFISAELKALLLDVYFIIALFLSLRIVWRLIDLAVAEAHTRLEAEGRDQEMAPLMKLGVLVTRIFVGIIFFSILLSYFGVNVTAIAAALGLGGLAVSLAARDTIADVIAGLIILVDRPFRIGDRIEIKGLNTWGDVVDIGLRTTSIRTRDNRMVIVPNSTIGNNEIVNYTYPDPQYRIQTHISIAYGTPIKEIQEVVLETMRGVDGVLKDKPVDVLYHEMGDSAMIFRIRWWIETYADNRRVIDRVHIALQEAIDDAGFDSPFPTQTIQLEPGSDWEIGGSPSAPGPD